MNEIDYVIFSRRYRAKIETQRPSFNEVHIGWGQSYRYPTGASMVDIEMPMDAFESLINTFGLALTEEEIRDKNPAVKQAYEQYRIMLALAK